MKQFEWKKAENCFGGANIFEYRLAIRADEGFIAGLSATGSVKYHRSFPRPFFQASLGDGTTVKGVIADSVIKVSFPQGDWEGSKEQFEIFLTELINQHAGRER
ncbi:hypothetical protein [Sporomusa sp.]|jgi:hypothetical protein|uniref:hypothetical protein n=1 Tax=Sporomusa sp. TaxID=2078658 RepID=UPI002CC027C3|nr:hypothetical protein [Sporomusa sp.]HWR09031.1 hypothetical protein [Sporomusa sp.]